jgi:hypothetical protein
MKTKIYTILFFALTLTSAIILNGCRKNDSSGCTQNTTTYNISSSDKSKIPYTGSDTLTFVRTTTGDTFTFYGKGWQSGINTAYTAEDCPQKEIFEVRQLTFQSPTFSKSIVLNQYIVSVNKTPNMQIDFQTTDYQVSPIGALGHKNNTIVISNTIFNYVDSFSNNNLTPFPNNYMCYYNIQFGILRMRLISGEIWELIPKK